ADAGRRGKGRLLEVSLVDVAAEEEDRSRSRPAAAGADLARQHEQPAEGTLEGRPMLEVEPLAQPFAEPPRRCAPCPGAERLAERLEVVERRREQDREGGREHEVVEVAGALVGQPA